MSTEVRSSCEAKAKQGTPVVCLSFSGGGGRPDECLWTFLINFLSSMLVVL